MEIGALDLGFQLFGQGRAADQLLDGGADGVELLQVIDVEALELPVDFGLEITSSHEFTGSGGGDHKAVWGGKPQGIADFAQVGHLLADQIDTGPVNIIHVQDVGASGNGRLFIKDRLDPAGDLLETVG